MARRNATARRKKRVRREVKPRLDVLASSRRSRSLGALLQSKQLYKRFVAFVVAAVALFSGLTGQGVLQVLGLDPFGNQAPKVQTVTPAVPTPPPKPVKPCR